MRRSILLFASLAFLATAFAQQPLPANARPRVRHLPFGLLGNVHTVMTKIEQLRQDPRSIQPLPNTSGHWSDSPLWVRISDPTWLAFDERGRIVEQGTISADGKFASLTRNDGNKSVSTVKLPGKAPEITERRTTSSAGASSTEVYRDGQLTEKLQSKSSGAGGHFEHQSFDAQGKLIGEGSTDTEIQAKGRIYKMTYRDVIPGPNGIPQERKIVDERSGDPQVHEHSEYDGNGNLLCTLRVSGIALIYSTMLPEAKSPCHIGAESKQESKRYTFSLYPNGSTGALFTQISTYSDMQRFTEPDTVERLDASGNVIDNFSFRYERDAQGNWTSRVVSVLDPATKDFVEIERDTRTITYYDQQ